MKTLKNFTIVLPAELHEAKLLKAHKMSVDGRKIVRLLFEVDEVEVSNDT